MENRNLSNLNPVRSVYTVIGSICQDTELLRHNDCQLKPEDFMQSLHRIVFKAINNIVFNASGDRVTNITAIDIDNYLSSYPTQYKVWNEQKGYEYIQNCLEHANKETFWQSYDLLKKMSILRAYVLEGFDVSDLYDWESEDFLAREKSIKELRKKI
ncbi:DnaB-like replicative helicase [Staphylococcus phage S-CoN_Ph10]|uniref:DNA helicase n=1 Tax=Staphylococcus phage CF9 TaxID=3113741 RepID=A0AAX4J758_9CAUD|nr:DnaB-like replicative helicase [Staphylococcus phage S-CoN_Ph10]WNM53717.1 DnaB-like replicative helicase [Staphylococcus phage S-CoN_Ph14]WNM53981.1 DnaB-like replicative helicase [Staphylococcus phage S-CoN_Ph15]WRW34513.1 DNA helicase [Staphylococcus phage CF9]